MSLNGNTEKINELISKINALPNAGGGGGGSVETCELTVIYDAGNYMFLYNCSVYTTNENGEIVPKVSYPEDYSIGSVTFTIHVLRNSIISLIYEASGSIPVEMSEGLTMLECSAEGNLQVFVGDTQAGSITIRS